MATPLADDARGRLVDALALLGVAVGLVAVHVLVPAGVRAELALRYANPDPLHALTAAYVHLTDAHLHGNVAGLLAGGGWALLVSHLAGERRWFRFSFGWYLVVLPVAVGMTGATVLDSPVTSRGFSGVVAGFAGFGLVGIAVVLYRAFGVDRWLAWDAVAVVVVVVALEIRWLVTGTLGGPVGVALIVGLGLTLVPFGRAAVSAGWPSGPDEWRWLAGTTVTAGLLAALVVVFVAGLFPRDLGGDGSVTNVLGHYLGLVYGAVIAGWGYRYWSAEGSNRRS